MPMPKDWNEVKAAREFPKLPPDGYVCQIMNAKETTYPGRDGNSFTRLEIAFDIIEGEYVNYFQDEFDLQQQEDKKWKGVLRFYYGVKGDGSQQDGWTKSAIKGLWEALESSNNGFSASLTEDWKFEDLSVFDKKKVGVLFRNEEWEFNNRSGWKAQPFRPISAKSIRENKYTIPKEKPLNTKSTSTNNFTDMEDSDDLPF